MIMIMIIICEVKGHKYRYFGFFRSDLSFHVSLSRINDLTKMLQNENNEKHRVEEMFQVSVKRKLFS